MDIIAQEIKKPINDIHDSKLTENDINAKNKTVNTIDSDYSNEIKKLRDDIFGLKLQISTLTELIINFNKSNNTCALTCPGSQEIKCPGCFRNQCPGCNLYVNEIANHKKLCEKFWNLDNIEKKYHITCEELSFEKNFNIWLINKKYGMLFCYSSGKCVKKSTIVLTKSNIKEYNNL